MCLFLRFVFGDDFLERSGQTREALDLARNDDLGRLAVRRVAERLQRLKLDDLLGRRGTVQQSNGVRQRLLHGKVLPLRLRLP